MDAFPRPGKKRWFTHLLHARSLSCLAAVLFSAATAIAAPPVPATAAVKLRCEDLPTPLGLDAQHPRLSWQMNSPHRGARQTAYQILVGTRKDSLLHGNADVWDSGRVDSWQSVNVPYSGKPLASNTRYYWQVRVWDESNSKPAVSEISWWHTGLLTPAGWHARWIANDSEDDRLDRESHPKWIWTAGEPALTNPKAGQHQFRFSFPLAQQPIEATLLITAKDRVAVWMNGSSIVKQTPIVPWGSLSTWGTFQTLDITSRVKRGTNLLAAEAFIANPGQSDSAGLIALLRVRMLDGSVQRFISNAGWKSTLNQAGDWYSPAFDDSTWQSAAIAADLGQDPLGTPWPPAPASYLRHSFDIPRQVKSAYIFATALGSYQLHLNGQRVGDQILAPGWTDYKARLVYQTYDVTSMLRPGANAIGVLLGDGWYASGLVWFQQRYNFGPPPLRLIAQLEIEYTDGSHETINTDETWKAALSPVQTSDIYNGENYDARKESGGWDQPAFSDNSWHPATVEPAPPSRVEAQNFQPIRVEKVLPARSVTHPAPGVYVFDLGQNMVGWERLHVKGPQGTRIRLRFGEVLDDRGNFYSENMRTAGETDTYILSGRGSEVFEPHFTYHGFRYIEVTGYPGTPSRDAIEGVVFHTSAPFSATFTSGDPAVNQLWSNIQWGQRGNFTSVPTDCPQRDERLGWMGDAQVFWRTASYNMDLAAFSHKFSEDMRIAQSPGGPYSDISPRVGSIASGGNPGWADAGIVIPWTAYKQYGDITILTENWDSMTRWLDYLERESPNHRRMIQSTYGDWLAIGSKTPNDLIATAYWAYDATLMEEMATALHKTDEALKYHTLFEQIKTAFQSAYVKTDGTIGSGSQTSYVLALHMNLLPDALRPIAAGKLVADIAAHQGHLTTGFLGTPYLMIELSRTGHSDAAYKLLFNKTYPSWGYMVAHGATTMWERWNGNQMLDDPGMNSFNHYAYGAVGEWLYRYVAGIDLAAEDSGYHSIVFQPQFNAELGHAAAEYDSPYGPIRSSWKDADNRIQWQITIPANATATLYFPAASQKTLAESGRHIGGIKGIKFIRHEGSDIVYSAESGSYTFTFAQ